MILKYIVSQLRPKHVRSIAFHPLLTLPTTITKEGSSSFFKESISLARHSSSLTKVKKVSRDVFGYKHFKNNTKYGGGGGGYGFFRHFIHNSTVQRMCIFASSIGFATYVYTLEQVPGTILNNIHSLLSNYRSLFILCTDESINCLHICVAFQQVTGRYHNILLSTKSERQLGERVYNQIITEARINRTLLSENDFRTIRVRRIGKRIAKAVDRLKEKLNRDSSLSGKSKQLKHLDNLKWEFRVVESNQINAFVVPGGKVCVYTGLLNKFRSDDELATVIGHEAAHVIARHTAENITHNAFFTAVKLMIALALDVSFLGSATVAVLFELPLSRRNELEADRIGLSLMADACYNPAAAPRVYSMLGDGGDTLATFLCTHPQSAERVQQIKQLLPAAKYQFQQKDCGRILTPLRNHLLTSF